MTTAATPKRVWGRETQRPPVPVRSVGEIREGPPMAYSEFTLDDLRDRFGMTIREDENLYSTVPEADLPPLLTVILERFLTLAVNMNTVKGRSELLIAPLLAEFKLLYTDRVSLFSGLDFNVDAGQGLRGRCDFLLSHGSQQLLLTAPVCILVEAKNEDITAGIPQCLAEMVAAQRFNERRGRSIPAVHGIVSSGSLWRFMRLAGTTASVDTVEYPIQMARKVFGILTAIVLA